MNQRERDALDRHITGNYGEDSVGEESVEHTPGPWTYQATAGNHDFAIYPESTGRDVALVRDFNEANARLIAVAPTMLEVLQEAEARLHTLAANDDTIGNDPTHKWVLGRVRAAIAQATGKTGT